jgi:hypothetical protein
MAAPTCPHCKADIYKVRLMRLVAEPETLRWEGPVPAAVGFACRSCDTLLPLTAVYEPAPAGRRETALQEGDAEAELA